MKVEPAHRLNSVKEYYFSRKLKEIAKLQAAGNKILNLGIGSPDLPPPPAVIEKLRASSLTPLANKYQSYLGLPTLRSAIADWYKKNYAVILNPEEEVLPLIGSKEGIMHISMSFLNPGDQVLIPNPGYPSYTAATNLAGASILEYKLNEKNNYWPDFEYLDQQDLSKVKIMWVNYPHMPTGTAASTKLFERLIQFAQQHKILICHDNPYSFVLTKKAQSLLAIPGAKDYVIELNSLSKSHHMSGWRVGMMVAKKDFIQTALKFKSNMDSGMYKAVQEAAITALQTNQDWHVAQNKVYAERQIIARNILIELGCHVSEGQVGMFVWGKTGCHPSKFNFNNGYELSDYILDETGVFITPGGIFGSEGIQYLRVSLCSNKETLKEALALIKSINE